MKIESLLRRKGGTKVTLDGIEYHFKPDAEGREFADVTNERHVGIFASISEGYRHVDAAKVAAPAPAPDPVAPAAPAPPPLAQNNLENLDRRELAKLYEKAFGHRPAPRLSEAKILQALYDGRKA